MPSRQSEIRARPAAACARDDAPAVTEEPRITLQLTADGIEAFCREIVSGSANTGRKHATLVALEGFIARHAGTDSHSPAYEEILRRIRNFSDRTRSELLAEQAQALDSALRRGDAIAAGRIHRSLSRNGFAQVVSRLRQRMEPAQRRRIEASVRRWCEQAEEAARSASGWPDAMNFRAAGIDLEAYRAMKDILAQLTQERP